MRDILATLAAIGVCLAPLQLTLIIAKLLSGSVVSWGWILMPAEFLLSADLLLRGMDLYIFIADKLEDRQCDRKSKHNRQL